MSDTTRTPAAVGGEPAPRVLELRVHGVNNTTPSALLDLPADGVRLAEGDKLGSFWEPTPDALAAAQPDGRGHVPPGIRREAYSWGGMVRTTPDFGGPGLAGKAVGVLARVFYTLVLPYAIGNAVVWTRVLSAGDSVGWAKVTSGITAGLSRLFGLVLTLLFTTTVATLALDVGAAQCGAVPAMCGPLEGVFTVVAEWTPGQRLAALALLPVLAVGVLWIVSAISQLRYDVLPGIDDDVRTAGDGEGTRAGAVLAQPGFWSNRVNRYLARIHFAAGICLTTLFVGLQASLGWRDGCDGVGRAFACVRDGWDDAGFRWWIVVAGAAFVVLLLEVALVLVLPTMRILTEREVRVAWPNQASLWLLVAAATLFGVALLVLAFGPTAAVEVERQYGAGMAPVVLVIAGLVLVIWGIVWRPRTKATAWSGRAPAVFMALALAVATAMSAIVVVTTGDFLNGSKGPASLIGLDAEPGEPRGRVEVSWTDGGDAGTVSIGSPVPDPGALEVSRSFVALGSLILLGAVVALLVVAAFALRRRDVNDRAQLWRRPFPVPRRGALPPTGPDDIVVGTGGVLPPSPANLFQRIADKRSSAARLHLVEPGVAVLSGAFAIALLLGVAWTLVSYRDESGLWPWFLPPTLVERAVNVLMTVLAWSGLVLLGVLALGGTAGGSRPLGIVWDIACALPRTAHPFGPPCYAERAVPEIAGRINGWLRQGRDRRAILAAHSMGAVLSMASIGLLSSSGETRRNLPRIAVLTFGVQLRPFFGRMLPELFGPDVLGTHTARSPHLWGRDPWAGDLENERTAPPSSPSPDAAADAPAAAPPVGQIGGTLVPRDASGRPELVRWISLWRLTDYLGYPAFSTRPAGRGWTNAVDRCASELDTSGYMVEVGTHGEYYRVPEYTAAVEQLRDLLSGQGD